MRVHSGESGVRRVMKRHVGYALSGVIASLMLLVSGHPGFYNDALAGEEAPTVIAEGKTIVITAGFSTTIQPGQPPSAPSEFSRAQLDEMLSQSAAMKVADEDTAMAEPRAKSAR